MFSDIKSDSQNRESTAFRTFRQSNNSGCMFLTKKVQAGNDQEKALSEKYFHYKNRGGKKLNKQSGTYTMKTHCKPNEQLFSQ